MSVENTVFSDLIGKTLKNAYVNEHEDELVFVVSETEKYALLHEQDCCESVYIESIVGELGCIIGSEIIEAEEVSFDPNQIPDEVSGSEFYADESFLWTFYKISTNKGGVTIRWVGESNGYYSESVDFTRIEEE